jgi:hypothetical protein
MSASFPHYVTQVIFCSLHLAAATTVVYPASFDQPILNIPHQTMVYDDSIHSNQGCLWLKF